MTLQEQFNAIKNGKGNKVQFLKQARSLFPQYLNQYSDFNTSVNVLKSKQIINEAVGGVVTKGFNITNWKQIFEAEAKAEEKTTSKEAADANKNAYQPSNIKNADNINFNEILKGYLAELGDVKNAGKTGDELKEIAVKNLAKDPLFYTKSGEFGIKGVGYTTEAPGLGEPKEAKGKHKSSGYGDIDKEIKVKANVKNSLGDQEAKDSMPKKVKEMTTTPQSSAGVKKMKMPGAEKKMKLQEIVTGENPYFDTDPSDGDADEDKNMAYGAENYYDKGKKAFEEGNLEKAQEYYEEALKFGSYIGWTERELPPYTKDSLAESKLRFVIAKLIKEELNESKEIKGQNIINGVSNLLKKAKEELNEISSDTFKSAINVSKERGTDRRTYKLGELYLNQFMDKDLIDGKITNIGVHSPQQGNYRNIVIEVTKSVYQDSGYNKGENKLIKDYIYYDIDNDLYDVGEINRKDAVILSKIAQHINPGTKYKETGKYFKIKGY